jgi:hypothetical protein
VLGTPESVRSTSQRNAAPSSTADRTPRARQLISTTASPSPHMSAKAKGKQPSRGQVVRLPPVPEHPNTTASRQLSLDPVLTGEVAEPYVDDIAMEDDEPIGVAAESSRIWPSQSRSLHREADVPLVRSSGHIPRTGSNLSDLDRESTGIPSLSDENSFRNQPERPITQSSAHHTLRKAFPMQRGTEYFDQFLVDENGEPLHDVDGRQLRVDNRYGRKVPLQPTGKLNRNIGPSGYRYGVDPDRSFPWSHEQSLLLYREVQKVPLLSLNAYTKVVLNRWGSEDKRERPVNLCDFNVSVTDLVPGDESSHPPPPGCSMP